MLRGDTAYYPTFLAPACCPHAQRIALVLLQDFRSISTMSSINSKQVDFGLSCAKICCQAALPWYLSQSDIHMISRYVALFRSIVRAGVCASHGGRSKRATQASGVTLKWIATTGPTSARKITAGETLRYAPTYFCTSFFHFSNSKLHIA